MSEKSRFKIMDGYDLKKEHGLWFSIYSSGEPLVRIDSRHTDYPDFWLLVQFSCDEEDYEYWHSLGFCEAFRFLEDDPFFYHSCPISGRRGPYSPKDAYYLYRSDDYLYGGGDSDPDYIVEM